MFGFGFSEGVITPKSPLFNYCYNVERHLPERLDVALDQASCNIVIIHINGGSTDFTLDVICRYADAAGRGKIIDKPNDCCIKSMNCCFDMTMGKHIGFFEYDEFIYSDIRKLHRV